MKSSFAKFVFLSSSNVKKMFLVNFLLFAPMVVILYTLFRLVPLVFNYVDSMNVSIVDVNPAYKSLIVVVISDDSVIGDNSGIGDDAQRRFWGGNQVYVFQRKGFNGLRKHIFLSRSDESSFSLLRERALAYAFVENLPGPVKLFDKTGAELLVLQIENIRRDAVEIVFYRRGIVPDRKMLVFYVILFILSFILVAGSLGGAADFTQRVVFHEVKGFSYLIKSIERNFFRSIFVSFLYALVCGAVAANIYFYIFIMSTDFSVFIAAVNFWMLMFFFFILLWVYPLLVLNEEESVWKVLRKSLYISFDNLEFAVRTMFFLVPLFVISLATLTIFPGVAGIFSYLNNALKEVSSRYNRPDMT